MTRHPGKAARKPRAPRHADAILTDRPNVTDYAPPAEPAPERDAILDDRRNVTDTIDDTEG